VVPGCSFWQGTTGGGLVRLRLTQVQEALVQIGLDEAENVIGHFAAVIGRGLSQLFVKAEGHANANGVATRRVWFGARILRIR